MYGRSCTIVLIGSETAGRKWIKYEIEKSLDTIVKAYGPPYSNSKDVYDYISNNIEAWIDAAIKIRNEN